MTLEVVNLLDTGPVPYTEGWERQKELVARRQRGEIADTLLLLEHPPTVTYGRGADRAANLLLAPDEYARHGITLIETDRGGDVTYHGPGQLVGYPIVHLGEGRRDVHRYVRSLEELIIRAVGDLGVTWAGRAPWHAGVWAEDAYLAALGVKVARWVTHHGFALNVTDAVAAGFATIIPCGVTGRPITWLSRLAGRAVSVPEAAAAVVYRAGEIFDGAAESSDTIRKY